MVGGGARVPYLTHGLLDPAAVWHHRSDGSRVRQIVGFGDRSTGRGAYGGEFGRAIVTNGDFTAYVSDSAATRPSSQITLSRLVFDLLYSLFQPFLSRY